MDILIIKERAENVVNGFSKPKVINASDALKLVSELHNLTSAFARLEKALLLSQKEVERLTKLNNKFEDSLSFSDPKPEWPDLFEQLLKSKKY